MTTQQSDGMTELATAFAAKSDPQQESQATTQEKPGGVDTTDNASSREETGADPSRSDVTQLSREELLNSLTLEELKAHPTLGKLIQSDADRVAAAQLRGKTAQIESDTRAKLRLEIAGKHFASLNQNELAQELAEDPDAVKLYAEVQAQPSPVPAEVNAKVDYYTNVLRNYSSRMEEAGLDTTTLAALDPSKRLTVGGDPDDLLSAWTKDVDDAIVAAKVAKEVGKVTKTTATAEELEKQALEQEANPGGPVMDPGRRASPLPDVMDPRISGTSILNDAFTRQAASKRSR